MKHEYRDLKPPVFADPWLVFITVALVLFSVLMVYSTTGIAAQERFGDPYFYVKRQGVAAVLGFILMTLASRVPLEFLKKISPYFFVISLLSLIILFVPGIGHAAGGAERWINLGIIRLQPGEYAKLLFIIFVAGFFARHEKELPLFTQGVIKPALLIGAIGVLYLLQPDFGSFVVVALITVLMGAVSGIRMRHLVVCAVGGLVLLGMLIAISPYRMKRVVSFLDPFADASGKGYQLIQSLIAIGTGQVSGVGIGESQQKLFFLPAAHTDFIFSVVGEELGFIGCCALLFTFMLFLWRGLRLANRASSDTFAYALAVGLTLLIVAPALFNTGVVTGLLPTKGMVLPLVGYGGSSLVMCLTAVGLLLAVGRASNNTPNYA